MQWLGGRVQFRLTTLGAWIHVSPPRGVGGAANCIGAEMEHPELPSPQDRALAFTRLNAPHSRGGRISCVLTARVPESDTRRARARKDWR